MKEEIILKSDPRAAEQVTLWKSMKGNYFHTEESARYDSCTHTKICECGSGNPVYRGWTKCEDCIRKAARQRYLNLPEGNLEFPCAIFEDDTYFNDEDDIEFYCEEHEIDPSGLELVNCDKVYLHQFDPDDYWGDEFPEDHDSENTLSKELLKKIAELNKIINDHPSIAYRSGRVRVKYEQQ